MSQNNAQNRSSLSAAQLTANRTAIHNYIAQATGKYGRGSVILLPEFEEGADGTWVPVQGNGIRPTSDNSAFLRFGKMTLSSNGKMQYVYSNHFADSEDDLANLLSFIDPTATIGSAVKGLRLVIHESLTPFSRTNPERDIKWADQEANLACMKADENGELKPIYRRAVVRFADDEGNFAPDAVNRLIEHDNKEELAENGRRKWDAQAGIRTRITELKAKATLTPAEKKELAKLTEG